MDNLIFFNPGDSVGNFHDYDEAVRSAQIYRESNKIESGHVFVVKGVDNKKFDVFLADDQMINPETDPQKGKSRSQPYYVSKKL
ncbi:hypothetical protein AYR62_07310 [Secundilactobacillus paracollinoides]|uniref:Uncharacterized protein n=1 Tax=Secundilactobacillus paracollinoides TaxID=240427 RepID=A0A1B2J1E8_9LACO|nr:hypothetical protein [Secundilactobacillus paracollinoides]ANZ63917.1 hypothetical protein AYR62_07310 [Secundilactobacillus paracollinoides]ANZ68176.1 hypothetical protein AYR63_14200 [Secundilactobacillus paracollinoides]KRL76338.1 hypothetical protein FC17_GL001841 [Secundilactobacillus paracollinoides DSM 15502 = JCM 11969]